MLITILFLTGIFFSPSICRKPLAFYDPEQSETLFEKFAETFNNSYSREDRQMRLDIFRNSLQELNRLNLVDTARFGINQFTDLTKEEFLQKYAGHKPMPFGARCSYKTDNDIITHDAPESLDWRNQGAVTDVKNQLTCLSSWAFATIGTIEGQYVIKHGGDKLEFSTQELLDCLSCCDGCWGCSSTVAMSSLIDLGGVQLDADYPYASTKQNCQYKPVLSKVKPTHCTNYDLVDENNLKEVLAKTGPLYIAVDCISLRGYKQGILKDCSYDSLNHAVLLIGYGSEDGEDYWLIKNSWGTNWGEQGFAKIRRGVNACGLMNPMIASIAIE